MAENMDWMVYSADSEHVASFKYPEDAARFVGGLELYTIRRDRGYADVLWTEGKEVQSAAESYQFVAKKAREREDRNLLDFTKNIRRDQKSNEK